MNEGTTTTTTAGATAGTETAAAAATAATATTAGAQTGTPAAAATAAATSTTTGQTTTGAGTTTGTTSATTGATADPAAAAAAAAAQGAPATYTLTVPEGGHLDQSDVDAFMDVARAKGLSNEAAQAVLNDQAAAYQAQSDAFLQQSQAHPEIGGANLEQAQIHANAALEKFLPATTPEGQQLRSLLTKTGYANHPALVLLLARIGKASSEDTPIVDRAGARGASRRSDADVLFG